MAQAAVTGSFAATGVSGSFSPMPDVPEVYKRDTGYFNVTLWGTFVGTVQVQRSFDDGVTWHPVSQDAAGTVAAYTAPVSLVSVEPEAGVLVRLECTAYTSGTINYRLSR